MKMFKIALFLFAITTTVPAWTQKTLRVTDAESGQPIAAVSFDADGKTGTTPANGSFDINQHVKTLTLSHIQYQPMVLSGSQLAQALKSGVIALLPKDAVWLTPIWVYGIKEKQHTSRLQLQTAEWVQHDAGRILEQVPGVSGIRKSGAFAYDPVYRGFSQDRLSIVSNGLLSTLAACPSRMDPPTSQVLAGQVEQVEIIKGPYNFRFGPVLGAVIDFKSPEPNFTAQPQFFGRLSGGFESNGEIYRTEGLAGIRTKNMQLSATGAYAAGSDYTDGRDTLIPASFRRASAGLQADINLRKKDRLSLLLIRNFARNVEFPTLMMDLLSDDAWMMQAGYTKKTGSGAIKQWSTQAYTSWVDHVMGNNLRPAAKTMIAQTDAKTTVAGGRTEITLDALKGVLQTGIDGKWETEDGTRSRRMLMGAMAGKVFLDTVWQHSIQMRGGVFAHWSRTVGSNLISLSTRADYVHSQLRNPAAAFKKNYPETNAKDVNLSLSAGISHRWNAAWSSALWLGRGARSAGLPERYLNYLAVGIDPYEILGNPHLTPEANHQMDVITRFKNNHTQLSINVFGSYITQYMMAQKTTLTPKYGGPGVRQYVNINKAYISGFEFSWQRQWLPWLRHTYDATAAWGLNGETKKPLPQMNPTEMNLKLYAPLYHSIIEPFTHIRYVAPQNRVSLEFGEPTTPGFATVNLGIKSAPIKNLHLSAALNNLFNVAYREHLSRFIGNKPLNATGRSLVIMAAYQF